MHIHANINPATTGQGHADRIKTLNSHWSVAFCLALDRHCGEAA